MLHNVALLVTGLAFELLWFWYWFESEGAFFLAPLIGFGQIVVFLILSNSFKLGGIIFAVMFVSLIVVLTRTSENLELLDASLRFFLFTCLASAIVHTVYGFVVTDKRKTVQA